MNKYPPLEYGKYYHIYNRGNNREDLFREPVHYEHFLGLLEKYIPAVADVFAWILMKNHFHLLARIREEREIGVYLSLNSDRSADPVRFKTGANLSESANGGPDRVGLQKPNITL